MEDYDMCIGIVFNGEIFILELNPNPDVSRSTGYVRALAAAGIEYRDFWKRKIVTQ
jgi:hypothetical protein